MLLQSPLTRHHHSLPSLHHQHDYHSSTVISLPLSLRHSHHHSAELQLPFPHHPSPHSLITIISLYRLAITISHHDCHSLPSRPTTIPQPLTVTILPPPSQWTIPHTINTSSPPPHSPFSRRLHNHHSPLQFPFTPPSHHSQARAHPHSPSRSPSAKPAFTILIPHKKKGKGLPCRNIFALWIKSVLTKCINSLHYQ